MRARRRNDKERMKRRAERIYPWMKERARKLADNLKACSCYMCRNLRESCGPTKQEIRADDLNDPTP